MESDGFRGVRRTSRAEAFRRAVHLLSPFWLSYYLLPPDAYIGVGREYLVVAILAMVYALEFIRISMKFRLPGLRDYERSRPAAHALGGLAVGLGLLFFPMSITIVAVCGMAWVDPLCGLTKGRRLYPAAPLVAYFVLAVTVFLMTDYAFTTSIVLAAVGSAVAIAAEFPNLRLVDDDFTMVMAPLLALGALELLLSGSLL